MSGVDPVSIVFAETDPSPDPELVIVLGQPGSGATRLLPGIRADLASRAAALTAESVAAFHPEFLELTRRRPLEVGAVMAPQVAEWIGDILDHARETRRSLVFHTSVTGSAPVLGTLDAFGSEGFSTRIVLVAARPAESLLATASRFLNARRLRLPARFTERDAHHRGWLGTRAVAADLETSAGANRVTVLDQRGQTLFDARRDARFAGVRAALEAGQGGAVSVMEGARWFGELRAVTDFARRSRELSPPLADVLVGLHQLALSDVLPRMPLAPRSSFVVEQEARLTAEIVELRRELPTDVLAAPAPRLEPTGPVVAAPAPSRGGPSL